jgi:hypothetical protein
LDAAFDQVARERGRKRLATIARLGAMAVEGRLVSGGAFEYMLTTRVCDLPRLCGSLHNRVRVTETERGNRARRCQRMKKNETILVYSVTGLLLVFLLVAVVFGEEPSDREMKRIASGLKSLQNSVNSPSLWEPAVFRAREGLVTSQEFNEALERITGDDIKKQLDRLEKRMTGLVQKTASLEGLVLQITDSDAYQLLSSLQAAGLGSLNQRVTSNAEAIDDVEGRTASSESRLATIEPASMRVDSIEQKIERAVLWVLGALGTVVLMLLGFILWAVKSIVSALRDGRIGANSLANILARAERTPS